jgi:hypothetical protein
MTGSKRRVGLRGGRAALVAAVAASALLALGASSAQAATFNGTFDDAALDVGGLQFDILDPPDTATIQGTIDNAGNLTVPPNQLLVPPFSGEVLPGVPVGVDFSAVPGSDITGTLTSGGDLTTLPHDYKAIVSGLGSTCTYVTSLAFSTAPGTPFNGDPFSVTGDFGAGDPTSISNGVMQTPFSAEADGSLVCTTLGALLNPLVARGGGIAIGNGVDITPSQSTTPAATTVPTKLSKRQRCIKKAKKIKDKQTRKKALKKCKKKKKKKK